MVKHYVSASVDYRRTFADLSASVFRWKMSMFASMEYSLVIHLMQAGSTVLIRIFLMNQAFIQSLLWALLSQTLAPLWG